MRNKVTAVKQMRIAAEDVLLIRSLRQMPGLVGVYLRSMFYPSDGELTNEGMHVRASLARCRHSERKEGVGSGERVPILFFLLPLDYVGQVFSCMACCIRQIGAGARVNDGNVE